MTFRPVSDRILVKRLAEDEKTPGGLFIPTAAKEKPARGIVVAIGRGRLDERGTRQPVEDIQVGDTVLFGKYAGTEVKLEGEDHMIMREDEILGVMS